MFFYGTTSRITDIFRANTDSPQDFLGAYQDRVLARGSPQRLIADNAPLYRGWRITRYLRDTWTGLWQCETKHQHQNPVERQIQHIKTLTNRTMSRFNIPACRWFLCMVYICFILNHTVDPNLGDGTMTPFMIATFETSDISPITSFHF